MGKFEATSSPQKVEREKWSNGVDFLFHAGGAMVGLGNIWRFPYLCYSNGGGAFLFPYMFFLCAIAFPLFSLETSVGQATGKGPIKGWKTFPIMRGIGLASAVILFYCNSYYPVVIAWALHYLVSSFSSTLQWSHCMNAWNTDNCFSAINPNSSRAIVLNNESVSSVVEFWERGALNMSSGIDHIGEVQLHLCACLISIWVMCYFCIWKGIKWTSKIIYVTATLPIAMVVVLICRGATLNGAVNGISYYVRPEMHKLANIKVWTAAASQVMFSYGLCYGAVVSLGSYNKINRNFVRDSLVMLLINSGSSFLCGFAVFSILGFMAEAQHTTVEAVAQSGPGLIFVAYPQALSMLPLPQLWSVLFFLTIILLGFDSQFVYVESFTSAITDSFPIIKTKRWGREILIAVASSAFCILGISMVTRGGVYIFNLFDNFGAAGWCAFCLCIFESVAGGWVGGDQYTEILSKMINRRSKLLVVMKYMWKFFTPITLLAIVIATISLYEPITYNSYKYPVWAQVIGWLMAFSSFVMVPLGALYQIIITPGTLRQKLTTSCQMEPKIIAEIERKLLEKEGFREGELTTLTSLPEKSSASE